MLQKCNLWNVATVFFDRPNKPYELIEISRAINLAHTSVKNHLQTLKKLNIIKEGVFGFGNRKSPIYSANKRNPDFIHYKKIYNLDKIKKSRLIEYLNEKCAPNAIVLFGSFQKGEDNDQSDIDIFVESSYFKLKLDKFELFLGRKIELHFKSNFKKFPNELKNNIINGTVIYGFLEGYDA